MIIAISGLHGTGKSSVGKLISENLNLKYYSTGQAFRELAEEKNLSLEEFTFYAENHPEVDQILDKKVIEIAKKGDVVIESQLSGHILKDIADFKIHLKCPLDIRVKRMSERDGSDYESKFKETTLREKSELNRFKLLYDIDLEDNKTIEKIHDFVIETKGLSIEEVVKIIISKIKNYQSQKS